MEKLAPDREQQSKTYARIKNILFFVNLTISLVLIALVLVTGLSPWLVNTLKNVASNKWIITILYAAIVIIISDFVFLPLSFYTEYILEHKYSLSNLTVLSWAWDHLKGLLLSLFLGVLAIFVLYLFLDKFTNTWWIWSFIAWVIFSFILGKLTPILLLPIFYKIVPLENEELTNNLIEMAKKAKTKILGVYKMDMSKKTKKANAMFTGIGSTKRIILGDTLLDNFSDQEIEVILAHELGHYYYKHIFWQLVFGSIIFLSGLYIADQALHLLNPMFGFSGVNDLAAFPLFVLILSIFFFLTMPLTNGFSRKCERQADKFALDTTKDKVAFISSMEKLADQNLADKDPPKWIEWLLYSHPAIKQRIKMANTCF